MSERFVVREEIQFRCYLQYAGPFTSDDHIDAMAEWERRAKDRFGQCQFGHVHVTAHEPAPVFGNRDRLMEFVVTGLVVPLDSTLR
jgi:hypothetical protein